MLLPALALLVVQDKTETKGKTYAQILAMGRSRWHDFYMGRDAGVTAAESSAEGIYADALAWRTDRLRKPDTKRLRRAIHAVGADAMGVGNAISEGGTMWNVIGSIVYADGEETLYAVLAKTGKVPHRVVSDVDRAYSSLKAEFAKGRPQGDYGKRGDESLASLRKSLDTLVALAARRSRRESDALLDFGARAMGAAHLNE